LQKPFDWFPRSVVFGPRIKLLLRDTGPEIVAPLPTASGPGVMTPPAFVIRNLYWFPTIIESRSAGFVVVALFTVNASPAATVPDAVMLPLLTCTWLAPVPTWNGPPTISAPCTLR